MADPKTKEELLQEIKNAVSTNERYKEFRDSLTDLNDDIDELMKPGKDGWKLLDEDTFSPFYDKYLKTAKKLSTFLHETRESTNPEDKMLWNICNAFRHYFTNDMEIMRKYRTELEEEPKSLPTLFESSRVSTVKLHDNNVDVRGGAMSSRMAMKVTKKNGEEVEGFFTRATYFDPLKRVQDALDLAAEKTGKEVEIAILKKFSDIYREYCRHEGFTEEQGADNLLKILNAVGKYQNNNIPLVDPDKFFTVYTQMIGKIGTGKAAEITGLKKDQVPKDMDLMYSSSVRNTMMVQMGLAWNYIGNMQNSGIAPHARLDNRNVAMCNVAHLLGMKGLICGARMMKLENADGTVTEGVFMEKARGVDSNHPGSDMGYVDGNCLKEGNCNCLKQLADLQVLDYICGNTDRHGGNMFFDFDEESGALIGVQGIDNDLSFGKLKTTNGSVGRMITPPFMGAISRETAEKVLNLSSEVLEYTLYGNLDKEEIDAAKFRLENMKQAIRISREKIEQHIKENPGKLDKNGISIGSGAFREIANEDWKNVNMSQLFKVKRGVKNIFVEAMETLNDFENLSRKSNKADEVDYVSTETVNRAEEAGISSRLKRTNELKENLSRWAAVDAPESFSKVEEALQKHAELLSKIFTRMENCKKKVKADTAETGEYFDQYVKKDDLEKIRKSEEAVRDAVSKYSADRKIKPGAKGPSVGNQRNRREIEAVADVHEFIKISKDITPEEEKTLKANHRRAVEDVARAIAKNPDSPAAGPKNPVHNRKPAKTEPKKAVRGK